MCALPIVCKFSQKAVCNICFRGFVLFPSIEEMKKAEKKHKGEDIGGRALTIRSYSYSSIGDYIVGTDTSVLVSVLKKAVCMYMTLYLESGSRDAPALHRMICRQACGYEGRQYTCGKRRATRGLRLWAAWHISRRCRHIAVSFLWQVCAVAGWYRVYLPMFLAWYKCLLKSLCH